MNVVEFPGNSLRDVAARLQAIALAIEQNEYGAVEEAVLVLNGRDVEVFGLGRADAGVTSLLLAAAHLKLARALLPP